MKSYEETQAEFDEFTKALPDNATSLFISASIGLFIRWIYEYQLMRPSLLINVAQLFYEKYGLPSAEHLDEYLEAITREIEEKKEGIGKG
jgi:hypothetical protein